MEDEIDDAINGDACPHPESVVQIFMALPHQPECQSSKTETENIIQLKETVLFLMVRFMDEPQRAME